MKKFALITSMLLAFTLTAKPKVVSALATEIWYLASGTITADTSVPSGESLLQVNNNATTPFNISWGGTIYSGPSSLGWWGQDDHYALVSVHDVTQGDPNDFGLFLAAQTADHLGYANLSGSATFSLVEATTDDGSGTLQIDSDEAQLWLRHATGGDMLINSKRIWGSGNQLLFGQGGALTPAVRVDTNTRHTFGDQFEVANNGDVVFAVSHDGSVSNGGPAWQLGDVVPATVTLVTDHYVQVTIGGVVVKLAVVE